MTETNYTALNGKDLIYIFQSYSTGSAQQTFYTISDGQDLNSIFQPYDGNVQADVTGFNVNGVDLNTIFKNIVTNSYIGYNPFSGSTSQTGYVYRMFNTSTSVTLDTQLTDAYIVLVGGGGGGGSGLGYSGGGAGGSVTIDGPITLDVGDYSITIGTGGIGGAGANSGGYSGYDGDTALDTIVTGPNGFSYTATGGTGGKGSSKGENGSGGTNSNSSIYGSNYGYGGKEDTTVTNVQGSGSGYGNDGYPYTFQDGTGTIFKFGGGGGAGGRNSSNDDPIIYYGGGGIIGTINGITYTNTDGGCGGNGYSGITNGAAGYDFSFNSIVYNTGSGGGAGGNNSALNYTKGGTGNDGIAILYFPIISNLFEITGTGNGYEIINGYYVITFKSAGTITFLVNDTSATYIAVGGGGSGGYGQSWFEGHTGFYHLQGAAGGGGGQVLTGNNTFTKNITYNITIGAGGAGSTDGSSNGEITTISGSDLTTITATFGSAGGNATSQTNPNPTGGNGGSETNDGGNGGGSDGKIGIPITLAYGSTTYYAGGGAGVGNDTGYYGGDGGGGDSTAHKKGGNGTFYGAGGAGGGAPDTTDGKRRGGDGYQGVVIIYFSQ